MSSMALRTKRWSLPTAHSTSLKTQQQIQSHGSPLRLQCRPDLFKATILSRGSGGGTAVFAGGDGGISPVNQIRSYQ